MENVVLTIHLILALALIGIVLLQRSEGGALGMGGGGTGSMAARSQATGLTKLTWILAVCFIITSMTLTILATRSNTAVRLSMASQRKKPRLRQTRRQPPGLTGNLLPPSVDRRPGNRPARG
jgi:preprotein translocase subunit SecG